jgi:hypothetical protein
MKDLYRGHRSLEIALILLYVVHSEGIRRDFAVNNTVKVGC